MRNRTIALAVVGALGAAALAADPVEAAPNVKAESWAMLMVNLGGGWIRPSSRAIEPGTGQVQLSSPHPHRRRGGGAGRATVPSSGTSRGRPTRRPRYGAGSR